MAIYGSHFLFFYLLLTVIYSMFLKLKWTLCCHCPVFGGPWDLGVFENMADTLTCRNAETTKQNNEQNWFISQSEVGNPKYLVFHILFFFQTRSIKNITFMVFTSQLTGSKSTFFFTLLLHVNHCCEGTAKQFPGFCVLFYTLTFSKADLTVFLFRSVV